MVAAGPNAEDLDWTRTLMSVAQGNFDALSLHYYTLPTGDWASKGPAIGFDEAQWASTFEQTYRIEAMIEAHDAVMDESDPEGKTVLAVDEWGTWYDPTPGSPGGWLQQQNSLRDGLLAAVNFNIFHRHADRVRLGNIAQMVNVLQAMILTDGPDMVLTPTYYVHQLYLPMQDATLVPVSFDPGEYTFGDTTLPGVDAVAFRSTQGVLHMALVNLDPHEEREISIELNAEMAKAQGKVLTGANVNSVNTFAQPDTVTPRSIAGRVEGSRVSVKLPPKSVAVLAIE